MLLLKEMVMVIDIKDRVKSAALQGKIVTASEAALLINPNDKVGISGFTPSGYVKAVPLALAERMEKIGADAVIVEGMESGGHVGTLTTMALLPQIVNAVSIPVIAAGGIASGKQFLAALAMGAEAIQCGTIFLTAKECLIHQNYKNLILKAKDRSTIVTGTSTGHPVRVIENKLAKEMIDLERSGAPKEEIEKLGTGSLRLAVVNGDVEKGSFMSGQVAAMVNDERTTKEILEYLMNDLKLEVEQLRRRLENWNI